MKVYVLKIVTWVVDALFGSGLTRDIEGQLHFIIDSINSSGKPVLALDIPSGLDGDTGSVRGTAVHADVTVTFISTKLGLVSGEGKDHRGKLEVDTLGDSTRSLCANWGNCRIDCSEYTRCPKAQA